MRRALKSVLVPVFAGVVAVQGVHVFEHVVQLIQVFALGIPEDQALGLLGYVFQFQGTEEWLHLVFNVTYLLMLCVLLLSLRTLTPSQMPTWAFATFALGAVGLESWHVVEHAVIIANVIRNNGCPCPGIGDAALGITDVVLHFFYNLVAYSATLPAFYCVVRRRVVSEPLGTNKRARWAKASST
jgi:hypothetical protein